MKEQKSLHLFEIFITALQLAVFIAAIIFQMMPCVRPALPLLQDGAAGIFLQVHATVLTLSMALISLMSGVLNDSYMGVSCSDYYLNLRPRFYTQLRIFVISLTYFLLSCMAYWFGFYYLVAAFLFCGVLLILMSAFGIYSIFGGKENIRKEIEEYLFARLTGEGKTKKATVKKNRNSTADTREKFIEAFGKVLADGRRDEYEDYIGVFRRIVSSVWESRNKRGAVYSLKKFEGDCDRLLNICMNSPDSEAKILCLRLVDSIYEQLFFLIRDSDREENGTVHHSFNIISARSFFNKIIRKVTVSELEDTVRLSVLLFRVQLVDLVLYNDCRKGKKGTGAGKEGEESSLALRRDFWRPNGAVIELQAILGQYISEQQRRGNMPTPGYWIQEFYMWVGIDNIGYLDKNSKEWFKKGIANAGIVYTCGLLSQGHFDIVKEGLYIGHLESALGLNDVEKKVALSVHAFLYYMACCESGEAVGSELQQRAGKFIEDPEVSSSFRQILRRCSLADVPMKNLEAEWQFEDGVRFKDIQSHEINMVLQRFDFRLGRRDMPTLIMSEVIDEFCLFMILVLYSYGMADLDWLGDEAHNIEDFIRYIAKESDVEDRIRRFVRFLHADILAGKKCDSQEYKDCEADSHRLYEILQTAVRDRYKEKKVREAREKEAEYLRQHDEIESRRATWVKDIREVLCDKFGTMIDMYPSDDVAYRDIVLFEYSTYTDMIDDRMSKTDIGRAVSRLIDGYIQLAKEKGCIEPKDRERDLPDDQEYINFLRDNELKVMLGSEYLLKNMDYRRSEAFEEATRDSKWIKSLGGFYGAAIREGSLMFCIKDLEAAIRPQSIEDEYYDRMDREKYTYEPVRGIGIQFDRNELSEFLGQERKIIEVTAKIGVRVYHDRAGIYFQDRRRPIVY